ncbi:MAG: hypothetical protein H8E44_28450 [Planctomycetes bacterium]|nr:hypothetical protein [Planctomycetota bacterium]MBL7042785.1 hypothetical protein [Pirellulaceae bacterium]
MTEPNDLNWCRRKNIWDNPVFLVGGPTLLVILMVGAALWMGLQRPIPEDATPPNVEVAPVPIEVEPLSFEPLTVFLLLACAVGIWLLVVLVVVLTWIVWLRLPATNDTREQPDKIVKPPPM